MLTIEGHEGSITGTTGRNSTGEAVFFLYLHAGKKNPPLVEFLQLHATVKRKEGINGGHTHCCACMIPKDEAVCEAWRSPQNTGWDYRALPLALEQGPPKFEPSLFCQEQTYLSGPGSFWDSQMEVDPFPSQNKHGHSE